MGVTGMPRPDVGERNRRQSRYGGRSRGDPTYTSWRAMLDRCFSPWCKDYKRYGARGISVCDRWRDFLLFVEDMGNRPNGMTLDRIDNTGHYEPGNCRWATVVEQNNNRRSSRHLTYNGRTQSIAQWAREIGVSRAMLRYRLNSGWPVSTALTTPINHGNGWKRYGIRSEEH